jgi:hypothetical protein
MADIGGDDAAAFRQAGLQRTPPQEELLTTNRTEHIRLLKAMKNWEQDPVGIFSDEQHAAIAGAAPVLGEEAGDLLLCLATEVQRVAGGGSAFDVQNVVLDQLAKLREEVTAREQEDSADGAGISSRLGAHAAGAQATAPAPQRQTRRSGSLQKQLEDAKLAVDEAVQHADQADDQDLAACEAALQQLLAAWGDLKGLLRGVAEAEKLTQKRQKQQEEQEAARVRPAKSRLEAAVRVLKEKLQRSRHLAATQAVNRSLADVEEVVEAGDPAEIGDLHEQLQKQREVMTATAVELGDEQLNAITELQITVDKSLRRLNRKRRELVRGTAAGSIFSPAPSEEDGDGGGDNALPIKFALPSAEEQNATSAQAGLSNSQLQQLLTTLAGGARSKLPPPSWPKFNDSYPSFFTFKDELEAFIKDYSQGTSDRTLAQQIKSNCLSPLPTWSGLIRRRQSWRRWADCLAAPLGWWRVCWSQ